MRDLVYTWLDKQLSFLDRLSHGSMVNFNICQLFHSDLNGCWVPLELTFIASAVVTRMRMHCYGHMAHGTSRLYTLVRSLHDLHSLGPKLHLLAVSNIDIAADLS